MPAGSLLALGTGEARLRLSQPRNAVCLQHLAVWLYAFLLLSRVGIGTPCPMSLSRLVTFAQSQYAMRLFAWH